MHIDMNRTDCGIRQRRTVHQAWIVTNRFFQRVMINELCGIEPEQTGGLLLRV